MASHETKICERCNVPFECKVGNIILCQCSTVKLTNEERTYLSKTHHDCLCTGCMIALKNEYHNNLFKEKWKKVFGIFYKK